jgi:arylsulfatase A-like enzyme
MRQYLACVQGVDDNIGKVLDYLEESGLAANTIVIYTTDNGFFMGELGLYDKRFMYEPGLRTPLLAKGPGIEAGIVPEQLVANIDLAPTFLVEHLLSLLPRPRPSRHAGPRRRPHVHAQVDSLLEARRLGVVRPRGRPP